MDNATRASGDDASVSAPIELGELRIDVARAEIQVRGGRIDAQPRLVELLGLLARESPRVLSRHELIEKLWPATAVTDHSLTVCVAEARRLLREATGHLWIETVPRRGYRLADPGRPVIESGGRGSPRPIVAVIGIENLTHHPALESLCDALTEEIATALALDAAPGLQARLALGVVTRRPLGLRCEREACELARELGAGYALSGSLRAAPGALDLVLHLIDARDGVHVWSRQQRCTPLVRSTDEAAQLCAWMRTHLARHELARARRMPHEELAAWQCNLLAHADGLQLTPEANLRARELLERAVALDPHAALPAALLAATYFREIRNQWTPAPEAALAEMQRWVERALAHDDEDPSALLVSADYWSLLGERQRALEACRRAVELAPSWFVAHQALGDLLAFSGAPEEALGHLEFARMLARGDPRLCAVHHGVAAALFALERYGDAASAARESLRIKDDPLARGLLVVALAMQGELREAARERRSLPSFSEAELCRLLACADPDFLERVLEGLRRARAAALCQGPGDALRPAVDRSRRSLLLHQHERRLAHALEEPM